jgi:hypothetical protein
VPVEPPETEGKNVCTRFQISAKRLISICECDVRVDTPVQYVPSGIQNIGRSVSIFGEQMCTLCKGDFSSSNPRVHRPMPVLGG